ncbi:MAG: hypothetical protein JXA90_01825 [Planctomycetes bacterium]|nr:hypothetical protein [Planctomycetota bacterium]
MNEMEKKSADAGAGEQGKVTTTDMMANAKRLPLVEKILGGIALVVIAGWIYVWSAGGWFGADWFPILSFVGALDIAAFVILKIVGISLFQPKLEKWILPVLSLLPVVGYLIQIVTSVGTFLTVGGSLALAYVSAMTYWRKHLPEFSTQPGGEAADAPAGGDSGSAAASVTESGPSGGSADAPEDDTSPPS